MHGFHPAPVLVLQGVDERYLQTHVDGMTHNMRGDVVYRAAAVDPAAVQRDFHETYQKVLRSALRFRM